MPELYDGTTRCAWRVERHLGRRKIRCQQVDGVRVSRLLRPSPSRAMRFSSPSPTRLAASAACSYSGETVIRILALESISCFSISL